MGQKSRSLLLLTVLAAFATGPEVVSANTNVWTSLGPDGADVASLVVDPQDSSTVYALAFGGVFKSADGGTSWRATGPGPAGQDNVLVIDRQVPSTIYTYGNDIFKSTDGGITWNALHARLSDFPNQAILALAIDPQNSSIIYATTYGGVFKSIDGGASWNAANSGLPAELTPSGNIYLPAFALAIDPQNSQTLYVIIFGPGILFKSTDGAASWSVASSGLSLAGCGSSGRKLVLTDPQNPSTLYLDLCGAFKSTDGGTSWKALNGLPSGEAELAIEPNDSNTIYAAIREAGVFKSSDGGATWSAASSGLRPGIIVTLAVDPEQAGTLYVGYFDRSRLPGVGVYKSTDGAASWNAASSGMRGGLVTSLFVDPQSSARLYANVDGAALKSTDQGASWNQMEGVYLLAIDPQNSTLYASVMGQMSKSTDGGANWNQADAGLNNGCLNSLVIDPQNTSTLYAGIGFAECGVSDGVWRSADGGSSWSKLGSQPNGTSIELAVDPQNSNILYAWNDDGELFKSSDVGMSWNDLGALNVHSLTIDPQNSGRLYATSYSGGVLKSADGGVSWSAVNSGLPEFVFYYWNLAIDPHHTATLYLATQAGVFWSADGGLNWSDVNSGLTTLSVASLTIDPQNTGRVYAGTNGGVFVSVFVPPM